MFGQTSLLRHARWLMLHAVAVLLATSALSPEPARAAALIVTTAADEINADGDCSLREAIAAANKDIPVDACGAGSGADTISFAPSLAGRTIGLSLTENSDSGSSALVISTTLTLHNPSAPGLGLSGNNQRRIFTITPQAAVSISGLRLTGGSSGAEGGAINNAGALTIADSTLSQNRASVGGAIASTGALTLTNATLIGNSAFDELGGGGAVASMGPLSIRGSAVISNSASSAGGIYALGGLTLSDSSFHENRATRVGGGLFVSGTLTLSRSSFLRNSAEVGGGVAISGTATLSQSSFSQNSADSGGGVALFGGSLELQESTLISNTVRLVGGGLSSANGQVTLTGSTVAANRATFGAGVSVVKGSLILERSSVTDNRVALPAGGSGGAAAIVSTGTLTVSHSIVSGNQVTAAEPVQSASSAGIFHTGSAWVVGSTISDNVMSAETTGSSGGGGIITIGPLIVIASTISGNHTSGPTGGGIAVIGPLVLEGSTVSDNTLAPLSINTFDGQGGGVGVFPPMGSGSAAPLITRISQSTLVGNRTDGQPDDLLVLAASLEDSQSGSITTGMALQLANSVVGSLQVPTALLLLTPSITSLGNNFIGSTAGLNSVFPLGAPNANGDWVGSPAAPLNPQLGPLEDNGGPTHTRAPLAGSPLIDAGDNGAAAGVTADQRGLPRRFGRAVDIGAVERQPYPQIYMPLL